MHVDVVRSQAALFVGQRPPQQRLDLVRRQRLELEDLAAADQCAIHREKRIARRRADQRDDAFLHVGQQCVLLGLVEAVNLVDEQQRPRAPGGQFVTGRVEQLAQVFHAAGHGRELPEFPLTGSGQQSRQCRFAGARAGHRR